MEWQIEFGLDMQIHRTETGKAPRQQQKRKSITNVNNRNRTVESLMSQNYGQGRPYSLREVCCPGTLSLDGEVWSGFWGGRRIRMWLLPFENQNCQMIRLQVGL